MTLSARPQPIRCTAPHPRIPGWLCGYRLLDAVPGTVELRDGKHPMPGAVVTLCKRCGSLSTIVLGRTG